MRTIVVANQKGGVGKTTTAVNLAVGLGVAGHRTLLIDMDPQANATYALVGEHPRQSVYDLLVNKQPLSAILRPDVQPLVDLLPSTIDLAGAEVELLTVVGGQSALAGRLKREKGLPYAYAVIDAPPSLGLLTINALAAADEVLIPVSTSVFGMIGIVQLENTIDLVRGNLNRESLKIGGVLCTMHDRTNVANDVLGAVRERFGDLVFKTVIPKNVKVEEAHSRQQSIFGYAPTSAGAVAYRALIEEVIHRGR